MEKPTGRQSAPSSFRRDSMAESDISEDPLIKSVVRKSLDVWEQNLSSEECESVTKGYARYILFKIVFICVCVALTAVAVIYALTLGDYPISFWDCYKTVWEHITGDVSNSLYDGIIFTLRLPRIEMAVLAGAGLAIAGVVMQSTMMNPLADSYTTGVSSGASLGATIYIAFGFAFVDSDYGMVVNAFVLSLVPMFIIIAMAKIKNASPTTIIMGGIAIMYLFNALTTVFNLMADPDELEAIYRWSVGTLSLATKENVAVCAVFVIPISIIMMCLGNKLNIMASGDESAKSLGVDADKFRVICLLLTALMTAAVVSFTGLIGFIGLVAPHIVRIFVGADNRFLLPASAAFGALLLVVSDLVGRTVIAPAILQVGVVTAFLGGPLFLWLILRKNSTVW